MNKRSYKLSLYVLLISSMLSAQQKLEITENTPIFSGPYGNSRVIALAKAGEEAQLLGEENSYYKVRYDSFGKNYIGYIPQSKAFKIKKNKGFFSELNPFEKQPNVKIPRSLAKGATVIRANQGEKKKDYFYNDCLWAIGTVAAVYSGYELMQTGYVVLGRDIIAVSSLTWLTRSRLVKSLRSWGDMDQIEVQAQAFDIMGIPRWTFSPGERGQIVLTLINRGEKRVKKIRPKIKLESGVLNKKFGKIKVKRGKKAGRRRYFIGGFMLDPGESMTTSVTFEIPAGYPATTLYVKGALSRSIYGTAPLAVERADPFTPLATTPVVPVPSVAVVDVEKRIPRGEKNPNAYAVVFGIEQYKYVSSVSYAQRDAYWMREYFAKTLGVPEENIYYKTDIDVGKAEFDKVFSQGGWLDKRIGDEKSDVYIFYAGHGAPDIKSRTAFLIPYDGDPNYASQTGYAVDEMTSNLSQLGARSVTVFLDACFSGANRENEILLAGARPVFMDVNTAMADNVTLFSAASGNQISSAWPEKQHGLFSYWLMKGMQGSADTNGDNRLTVEELGGFIRNNVSTTAGRLDREQTPGVQTLDNEKVLIKY